MDFSFHAENHLKHVQVDSFSYSWHKGGQRHIAHLYEDTWLIANLQSIGCKQLILPLCFVSGFQSIVESKKRKRKPSGDKTHFTEERCTSLMIKKKKIMSKPCNFVPPGKTTLYSSPQARGRSHCYTHEGYFLTDVINLLLTIYTSLSHLKRHLGKVCLIYIHT